MLFSLAVVPALAAVAAAFPAAAPQDIDLDLVIAAPNPTYTEAVGVTAQVITLDATAIAAQATDAVSSVSIAVSDVLSTTGVAKRNIAKRSGCAAQPTGVAAYAVTNPDTASAFAAYPSFASIASAAPTPSGYTNTFTNLNASNNAYGYLGYTTLSSYDTASCATKCSKINGCMSFNLYFERDPSVDPGSGASGCANPASVTMVKCVFWGGPVSSSNANNYGQYRNSFQVVIAGSNGYTNNTLVVPSGYTSAAYLGNVAINAPYDHQGYDTFMGSTIFSNGPFNASLCAAYCDSQSVYNRAHPASNGSPAKICRFFNTYLLYLNSTANMQGQYCSLYTEAWSSTYATNSGQYRGNDHYVVEYSYTYTNATDAGFAPTTGDKDGAVHQASVDMQYATLAPFCSTYLGYSPLVATATAYTTTAPVVTSTTIQTTTITGSVSSSAINQKRAVSTSTPAVLTKYPASVISSACSLYVKPASVTSTTTATTVTVSISPSTTIATVVSTVVVSPIPTACGNKGIQFAYYYGEPWYDYINYYMDPQYYWDRVPTFNSTTTEVGGIDVSATSSSSKIELYGTGYDVPYTYFVLNHRGYIFAQTSGTYTFTISNPDDIVWLYLGDKATSGYMRDNSDAAASCVTQSGYANYASATHTLNAGDYLPFRIVFGQQGGPVEFNFQITAPDGTVILGPNTAQSDFIVQYSCDGTSAPAFADWGNEGTPANVDF